MSYSSPLPAEFLQRLTAIVPPSWYDQVFATFHQHRTCSFRVNTLRSSTADALAELSALDISASPVPWCAEAFVVPHGQRSLLSTSAAFSEGRIYIQNLSSMAPVLLLNPRPGEQVLDLAAAPGGKTLHLAALMENRGWISAVEAVKDRFFRLKANVETFGASIVHTYLRDGRTVGLACPEHFDRVLLDAPCSSEARFHADNPASWQFWSPTKIREAARKQKPLLFSAWQSLKPGGTMVYCTCSFAPEENEAMVAALLKKYGDAVDILPLELPFANTIPGLTHWLGKEFDPRLERTRRILPDAFMDGFYLAHLRKVP